MFELLPFIFDVIRIVFIMSCLVIFGVDLTPRQGNRIRKDRKALQKLGIQNVDIKWRIKMVIIMSVLIIVVRHGLPYIFMFITLVGEFLKL